MRFTFLLKSILFSIGILLLNVSFGQNRLYHQVKDFTPEQKQMYDGSATLSNLIPNTNNDTIPKSILNELKQNQTLKSKFKTYDIININSSAMVRQAKSTTRSEVFNMSLGENESISFNLKPSNILSENYSMILGEENGIKEIRGFSAIPMVGKLTDVENSKVSLTVNDNFIYGFIKIGFEYYNIEPLYHFIENAPNDTYIFYSSKDIIHTRNMTCGFEEMQNETKKANDRINPEGKRMQGGCYTVLYAIASDFLMFQNYGTSTAVQNHNIAVMNDVQTNYDDEFADEVRFQIQQQWVSTCASCDPWTNSTDSGVLLNSFRSWGPTGFTQTHNLASLWSGRDFDGNTVGRAYLNALCNSSRYNVLEDYTSDASSKRVLVAHEIGHNFGASHDEPGSSTIMAPSVNYSNVWSAQSINSIQTGYINATCLGNCGSNTATTPTNVQASDGTFDDKVQISWTGLGGNFFRVYRNTTNSTSGATVISNWQSTQLFYNDFSANPGTTYYYFVQAATNSSGANSSAYSNINGGWRSNATTVWTPTNVAASDGTFTDKVQITWSGLGGNYFRVYRNTTNSNSTATALGTWQNAYLSFDDFTATAGVTYYYFVRAASNSSGSNISAFSTSNAGYRNSAPVVTTPTGVQASDGSFTDRVQVTWSGNSGNFFRVYRNTTNSSSTATALGSWQTSFSYDDYNATAGVTYYYFVRAASNSSGSNISAFSTSNAGYRSSVPVVTTPTSVQASDGTFTDRVQVTWSGTSGNYFRVYRNTTNSSTTATALGSWQTAFSYDDYTATAGVTYYYFVRAASNSSGSNISAFSTSNAGYRNSAPLVTTPTGVQASDGSFTDRVQVTWSGNSGNFFRVYRNTTNSSSTATALGSWQTAFSYDDYTATAGVTYYYFVRAASNSSGSNISAFSTSNQGYRNSAPVVSVPSSVNASDGTYSDKVRVTWAGTSGNYFRVIRNTSNSTSVGTVINNWQNTQLYFDDLSAVAGTTYYYFVQAASSSAGANPSSYSVINSGWRSVAPVVSVPSSVNASDGTYTERVQITWSGTSGNYFRVYRNTTNSSSTATALGSWQTAFSYDDYNGTAGVTYYYFVRAASNSSGSNISAFSNSNAGYRNSAPVVTTPTSVQASDGSFTNRVQVTWSGTSGNFFRVYRNTTNSSSTATALGSWQTSFSYDDYNATAGVTYYYFVRAASNSSGSNISSFSTSNSGYRSTSCGTPTGLQTSQITSTTCNLNWNAVSGATQYSLWYHNGSSWIQFGTVPQNSAYITNMVAGSQYCLAVKAICGGVSGNLSAYVCLTPGFNGGGNNTQSLVTDVNYIPSAPEVTVSDMSVFPNPAIQGSEINLQYSSPAETQAKIIVYDVSGKIVSQLNINIDAGENVINMQAPENAGLYICRMIFQNGSLLQTKLIVH